jgi:ribonucleotide reductase alpha subunit
MPGESPLDVVNRVCETLAIKDASMIDMLCDARFIPAGRTLKTAHPLRGVFPNCTVLDPDVDRFKQAMAQSIGVGTNLDSVRDPVECMKELGKIPPADPTGRKPGIMATLSWRHERAQEFCVAKTGNNVNGPLFNMNTSLLVREDEWDEFEAHPLFRVCVESAFACGDPGILIVRRGETAKSTSPCGELWLSTNEVCNLGNLNLAKYLGRTNVFDSTLFEEDVERALAFLDCVRSVLAYPLDGMRQASESRARLGLGVMGFADLLTRLRVEYGSKKSLDIAETIASMMKR